MSIAKTPREVIEFIKKQDIKMVDLRFVNLFGTWQHFPPVSTREVDEGLFEDGIGFDGSSIRGFQTIDKSDMLLIPDANTLLWTPFLKPPPLLLSAMCMTPSPARPIRAIRATWAKKAEAYLKQTGIADSVSFLARKRNSLFLTAFATAAAAIPAFTLLTAWKAGGTAAVNWASLAQFGRPRNFPQARLLSSTPAERPRCKTCAAKWCCRWNGWALNEREVHHHEVATAGQCEIDMRFNTLTLMADWLMMYKYIVKSVNRHTGMTATFMPKPLFGDNGSGMHTHQSLWKAAP